MKLSHRIISLSVILVFIIISGVTFFHIKKYQHSIPRVIHYIWVGPNDMPDNFPMVLASWKKNAPDFRLHKIDESTCDVNANEYVREAYAQKMYNFVSDYCRFVALEKEGGLYLDTDHILTKSPNKVLSGAKRILVKEDVEHLSGSFIAVQPHDPFIQKVLKYYETNKFNKWPITQILTHYFKSDVDENFSDLFYEKNGTRILPTNIAMIDFGGGENIALHIYNVSIAGTKLRGLYYEHAKNLFLNSGALHLCDESGTKQHFILDTPTSGYVYETKKRATIIDLNSDTITLGWFDQQYPVQYSLSACNTNN